MDERRQKWENAAVLHLMSIYIATHINKQHLPSSKPQFNYKHCYVQLSNARWYTTDQLTDTGRHGIKGFFWTYRIRDQSTLVVLWLHTYKWWCSDCNSALYQKKNYSNSAMHLKIRHVEHCGNFVVMGRSYKAAKIATVMYTWILQVWE